MSGGSSPTIVTNECFSVFGSLGCKYSGVVNAQSDADLLGTGYNGLNGGFTPPTDIDLKFLGKIDAGNFGSSLTFVSTKPGEPNEITAGTYTNTNWVINYFAVKAGNKSVLFAANNPSSSIIFNTQQLSGKGMSHIVFFGSLAGNQVPEPATWAMMIGGFGLVGAALRRRKRVTVSFA